MAIKIKGIIGWDIIGTVFADMISRLSGDLDVEIDSPGGSITDGISIFNALKGYDKGKVNIHVVGECSSMAAYDMLGGDTLTFEPNSIIVLHNPWTGACGDYRTFLHEAEVLQKLTALYAGEFVKRGIFDEPTIRAYMDSEKWFIGPEDLKLFGNVIERDIPKLKDIERESRAAIAKDHIKAWQAKAKKDFKDDLSGAAALIAEMGFNSNIQTGIITPVIKGLMLPKQDGALPLEACTDEEIFTENKNRKENKIMDLNELKTSHPDIYAEVLKQGIEQGKAEAQKATKALLEFIDDDKATVIQAINEGKTIRDDEVYAKLTKAKINANTIKEMQNENPKDVTPAAAALELTDPQAKAEAEKTAKAEQDKAIVDEIVNGCKI